MAPEQAIGQPSALTDIYAMGLIAYEMVTGRKPFVADNAVHLAALQRAGVRVKPSDLRPSLSAAAERLILQSLEYEPSRRPRDARAFGDQLHDALLNGEATRLTTRAEVGTDAPPRKKKLLRAAAIVGAIFAGKAAYEIVKTPPPPRRTPAKIAAPAPDVNAEQAIELAFWNSVKDSSEPQLYQEYLDKYPEGRFASLAETKLEILARKEQAKPAAAPAKVDNSARDQEVELAFWESVKDATEPQLLQDYLDKYPHGRFETLARTKLDMLTRKPPSRNASIPVMPDLRRLAAVDPKMAAELSEWNALGNAKGPQPYRDYLAKYPNGMFATVARIKIASFEKKDDDKDFPSPGEFPFGPPPPDRDGPDGRHHPPLPPLRPALNVADYTGPQQGELHWSGSIPRGRVVIIQGGKPNAGTLTSDLPRVPVTVEVVGGRAKVLEPPAAHNHWDRLVIKEAADSPASDIVIRWKVAK